MIMIGCAIITNNTHIYWQDTRAWSWHKRLVLWLKKKMSTSYQRSVTSSNNPGYDDQIFLTSSLSAVPSPPSSWAMQVRHVVRVDWQCHVRGGAYDVMEKLQVKSPHLKGGREREWEIILALAIVVSPTKLVPVELLWHTHTHTHLSP